MAKRELDDNKVYKPVHDEAGDEVPSQLAYPMGPIKAVAFVDKKLGPCVRVERDDVAEPVIYTEKTDGYQYWLSQAKAQAE